MTSAAIIREARRSAGLTQAELARRLGVAQPVVARLETRAANPTVETLDRTLPSDGASARPGDRAPRIVGRREPDPEAPRTEPGRPGAAPRTDGARGTRNSPLPERARVANGAEFRPSELVRLLSKASVDYVVVGGVAVVVQAHARFTDDLDICYATDRANLISIGRPPRALEARCGASRSIYPSYPTAARCGVADPLPQHAVRRTRSPGQTAGRAALRTSSRRADVSTSPASSARRLDRRHDRDEARRGTTQGPHRHDALEIARRAPART